MSRPRAFYRSSTFRIALALATLGSSWSSILGPEIWRATPGLKLVRSYGFPWWVWGIAFLAVTVMLCFPDAKWHARAEWWALFLYGIVFISVLAAIRTNMPTNLIICSLASIGLVALYQAAKLATFDREGL